MSARPQSPRGFTLLEVMIAMAILAISLVALSEINAGAIAMHAYAKKLNVATMLARGKMLDIETQLDEKGLPAEGENISPSDGDFEDEGFANYKWKVEVVAPKSDNLDPQKLMNLVLGGAGGGDDADPSSAGSKPDPGAAGGGLASMLGSLTGLGGSSPPGSSSGAPSPTSGIAGGMGGMIGTAMAGPAQMMITQITQMVREVRLTVTWMDGKNAQEFTVVEQIVSMGQPTTQRATGSTTKADPNNILDQ